MPHTAYELVQENEAGGPEAERPGLLRGFIQEEGNMWKDFLGKLGAAGNAQGLQTVSYTHLDVYKRQGQHRDQQKGDPKTGAGAKPPQGGEKADAGA